MEQEPPVGLHGREQLGLVAALHVSRPTVTDHPASQELVVPRVEMVFAEPEIVGEAVDEIGVLENDGPVRGRPPREAGDTTVHVGGGGDLDVPDGQPEGGEHFPDGHPVPNGLDTLGRPYAADFLVLKGREDVRQHGRRPDGIVVGEADDIGGALSDAFHHLETLVGEGDGHDADAIWVDGLCEFLEGALHLFFGDDDDLLGLADEP